MRREYIIDHMRYKPLNLIVVCGSLYRRKLKIEPCSSGSDISMEEEIDKMKDFANRIDVISLSRDDLPNMEMINNKMKIHRVSVSNVKNKIHKIHKNEHKGETDYIVTQLLLCDIALKTAKELGIKTIYYMRSMGNSLPIGRGQALEPTKFVANCNYVAKRARTKYGVRPIISYASYTNRVGDLNIKPKYDFLMFNPNSEKGGDIFLNLVQNFPNCQFLAVRGWEELKNKNGELNRDVMLLMSKAHGNTEIVEEYLPHDTQFPKLDNLTLILPQKNSGDLLQNTKILLVPSQWDEAFPRVIIEAGLNNRLVIASKVGGIPEAMKVSGMSETFLDKMLVGNFSNPAAWGKAVTWCIENIKNIPLPTPKIPPSNIIKVLY